MFIFNLLTFLSLTHSLMRCETSMMNHRQGKEKVFPKRKSLLTISSHCMTHKEECATMNRNHIYDSCLSLSLHNSPEIKNVFWDVVDSFKIDILMNKLMLLIQPKHSIESYTTTTHERKHQHSNYNGKAR